MTGQEVNGELAAAETATPDAVALHEMDYALGGVRLEIRAALIAYKDASAAQERLLNHMERIVKFATGQVQHG